MIQQKERKDPLNPPVGEESVTTENTAPANCPPETGGTRSEATEGVDDTNGLAELDERRRLLKLDEPKVNNKTENHRSPLTTLNINPQTLAITGVPADCVLLLKLLNVSR